MKGGKIRTIPVFGLKRNVSVIQNTPSIDTFSLRNVHVLPGHILTFALSLNFNILTRSQIACKGVRISVE